MIDDDMTALPEAVRDFARLYLDQIAVLTQKIMTNSTSSCARRPRSTTQRGGCGINGLAAKRRHQTRAAQEPR
ncbi:MAG: hypothetical protein K2W81_11205 [Sphingomonas sp.]|uniref:hypothetical protein n=1 Tax=Sphingomonas sp. TaxID=28214 RepID=UPI0025FDC79B|nr:hypothetical protein [Sphingomonas sp.]MBY0284516.1 hypothetical protein [Sphingomonas sp.]